MRPVQSLLCLVLLAAAHITSAEFVMGFLAESTNMSGYTLASLADVQSDAFRAQYNAEGLSFVYAFPGGPLCCVVSVAEGYLSFGSSDANSNFLESFASGQDTCTTSTTPLNSTFGVPTFLSGPYAGTWLQTLTPKESSSFRVSGGAVPAAAAYCGFPRNTTATQYTAIYKATVKAQYVVRPRGPNFPAPSSEYQEMTVEAMRSDVFQSHYNSLGGIIMTGSSPTQNYCCLIRVADGGWLSYGPEGLFSPLSLANAGTGMWQCNYQSNNQIHWLSTSFGGSDPATLATLNNTIVSQFGYFVNNTQDWDGCIGLVDSLTIYQLIN